MRGRPVVQMLVVGVLASAAGIALGLAINWFPTAASTQAHKIDTVYDVLIIVSVPMFVLVTVVVLFSVIHFRMRPGQEDQDGPPIHGNTKLEIVWTAIPALMLISLCTYAYVVLRDIERTPANAATEMRVDVTGRQFAWTFAYPKAMTGGKRLETTELVLPEGRSVNFRLHSEDVLHDFWVPAFRVKEDAVPGITTHYRITPSKLGTYPIVCAELCGLGHSVMRSRVRVVSGPQFAAWLKKASAPAVSPALASSGSPSALAAAGKQVFTGGAACGSCHTLADAGTAGQIGPDLDKVLKPQSTAMIRQDIVDPNAVITKGYPKGVMPQNFGQSLSPDELKALVAYLKEATK